MNNIDFINLHSHTSFSVFDGLGMPNEHFDFVVKNGMNAMAISEHGHMNSFVHAYLAAKDLNKKGINFKYLPAIEFYIHPDLNVWKKEFEKHKEQKKIKKEENEETATIENEEETKSNKYNDPIKKRNHLVALAKTTKGLYNLFSLVSLSYKDGFYKFPRIDYNLLNQFGEDLVISSACCGGSICSDVYEEFPNLPFDELKPELLNDNALKNILSRSENTLDKIVSAVGIENTFLELQFNKLSAQHLANKCIIELSKKTGIKLVVTADSHYPTPEHWKDRELYKKIGWLNFNKFEFGKLPESKDELKAELYPKNGNQVWDSYKETTKQYDFYDDKIVLDAIKRTHSIAYDLIADPKPQTDVKLPSWVVPKDKEPIDELKKLSFEGLQYRKLDNKQEYINRLNEELELIKFKGLEKYFLTMRDIIRLVENDVLINSGRGSAAGSLVCYCLRITNIDPIKFNLLFSRFINKFRKGMPDIDSDFSNRDKVIGILKKEYGEENVINISNINTLKIKSLVKDISKFYNIPYNEVNEATKNIDQDVAYGSLAETGDKNINPNFDDALKYSQKFKDFVNKHPEISNHINVLYKQIKAISQHAGGVVICENILKQMPVISSKGNLQTPWSESGTVTHLEEMGWIKFDLLGVETLATIENCIELILKTRHNIPKPTFKQIKEWYDGNLDPNIFDLNNQKVYEHVYHDGRFAGIFQFSEIGVQNFIKQIKPTCIDDISSVTSLFRPGPLRSEVDKIYIENRNNKDKLKYDHPLIEKVLANTYNCLIFQEQAMSLANIVGNIPLDECDNVRKLISKKPEPGSEMEKQVFSLEGKFVDGAISNGIDKQVATSLFDKMKKFAKYSFNAAHSYSYSILSYQTAYLLTYFEDCWLAAFLNKEPEDKKEKAVSIVKGFGYDIVTVDINNSGESWYPQNKSLVQPLNSIKGLGEKAIEQIVNSRPFNSIEDLLFNKNIVYSKLNKKSIDVLTRCGACDCLMDQRFKNKKHFWLSTAFDRPKTIKEFNEKIEVYKDEQDFSHEEKISNIVDLTGVFPLSLIIDDKFIDKLEQNGIPGISDYDSDIKLCWFIPRILEIKKTKTNRSYLVMKVIDNNCKLTQVRCWGYNALSDKIHTNKIYMSRLNYDDQYGFSMNGIGKNMKMIG